MNVIKKRNLSELLSGIKDTPSTKITGICDDSRNIKKGDVFFAFQGDISHGMDYLEIVIEAGAAAIIYELPYANITENNSNIPIIGVDNLNKFKGEIANRWHNNISKKLKIIGITGTNGKTTVAALIQSCLHSLGHICGYIGTLGLGIYELEDSNLTTPSNFKLHQVLADFYWQGAKFVVMEVSSHSIAQNRIAGIPFDATMFTNLTQDHLDYHKNMRSYGEIKSKLFTEIESKIKIINCIDDFGKKLSKEIQEDVIEITNISVPREFKGLFLNIEKSLANGLGYSVSIQSSWGHKEFNLPLIGAFNVENASQVIALLLSYNFNFNKIVSAIKILTPPKGRMQLVRLTSNKRLPKVYIDFAHTPEALKLALMALRSHYDTNIWCVFGCGGDRDQGKRKLMGHIAEKYSDYVVITSDNPRGEDPKNIINDILEGVEEDVEIFEDRAKAIQYAIQTASDRDIILIAGKGHEGYQLINNSRITFVDNDHADRALKNRLNISND